MIHSKPDGEWVSDLLGEPSYCNSSWKPDCGVTIVSAGGNAEVDIDWKDIPRFVSDLLLIYEQARAHCALVPILQQNGVKIVPLAEAKATSPNMTEE